MSKVIYAYSRISNFKESIENKLDELCKALTPDNVSSLSEHKICVRGKTAYAVIMNSNMLRVSDLNLLLGYLYEEQSKQWGVPTTRFPDGNYAIFRNNDDYIEIVSDGVGSRTIWYYFNDDLFIASTSQRAIILFLGSFVFDDRVIPWMLSTGSLGPEFSWDQRLKRLQADSSVLLDKRTWTISVIKTPILFLEKHCSEEQHRTLLTEAIRQTITSLRSLDFSKWVLPLSGGYDSRAILCFIKDQLDIPENIKTVTWGLEGSEDQDGNDAKIARDLARSLGTHHDYLYTDNSSEPIEVIINRFLLCSEGRIDHIEGYMDGMEIWRRFREEGIYGVIRGDEGFGWVPVSSELTVRLSTGCELCEDFSNLKNISADFGFPSQQFPQDLIKGEKESLNAWRDRLYHTYRIPTIIAALSDIKYSYVEQITPWLSKSILSVVRAVPDHLRTNKILFREIVTAIGPNIPFADKSAVADSEEILNHKSFVDLLKNEINSNYANKLLGKNFVQFILDGIIEGTHKPISKKHILKKRISLLLPNSVKNFLRKTVLSPHMDGNVLAFRVFIILKMNRILRADAGQDRIT